MGVRSRITYDLIDLYGTRFRLTFQPEYNETIEECVLRHLQGRKLSIRSYNYVVKASLLDEEARRQSQGGNQNAKNHK